MEKITLFFTDDQKYQVELSPPAFWMEFAMAYKALPWTELSDERLSIVAEGYSYLLNILVEARDYYRYKKS